MIAFRWLTVRSRFTVCAMTVIFDEKMVPRNPMDTTTAAAIPARRREALIHFKEDSLGLGQLDGSRLQRFTIFVNRPNLLVLTGVQRGSFGFQRCDLLC